MPHSLSSQCLQTGLAGAAEVVTTYPTDYLKTLKQSGDSFSLFKSNPYRGFSVRLAAVLPVRLVFWGSYKVSKTYQWSPTQSALFMSLCETAVDFPAEQVKIQRMLNPRSLSLKQCFVAHSIYPSLGTMFGRNLSFLLVYHHVNQVCQKYTDWSACIAGLMGSIVSHPFDTIKTYYQSQPNNVKIALSKSHLSPRFLFAGCAYRCVANFIGMGIGDYALEVCPDH